MECKPLITMRGERMEVRRAGCTSARVLKYRGCLLIGINAPQQRPKPHGMYYDWLTVLCRSIRNGNQPRQHASLPPQPAQRWRDWSTVGRNLRRSVEIHSSSQWTAMFLQVPPAGFNKSLLPTQSRSSPALQHYKHLYFQSSNYDKKKTSLNSYTIIASKCFVFVLRCSESPLSPMFLQLLLDFAFSLLMSWWRLHSTQTIFSQANISPPATNGIWCQVPAIKMSGTLWDVGK